MNNWSVSLLFVLMPLLAVFFASFRPEMMGKLNDTTAWFFIAMSLSDNGHIFMTWPSYLRRVAVLPFKRLGIVLIPALVLILSLVLSQFYPRIFISVFAYAALFHLTRQQIGIFRKIIFNACGFSDFHKKVHIFILRTFVIFPVLHWHSFASKFPDRYYTAGDLIRVFPKQPFAFLESLFPSFILLSLLYITIYTSFNLKTRFLIFAFQFGTAIWFYFGLVVYPNTLLFWMMTPFIHGYTYYCYVISDEAKYFEKKFGKQETLKRVGYHMQYLLPIAFVIAGWIVLKTYYIYPRTLNPKWTFAPVFQALLAFPALTHFVIDGFVWKSKVDRQIQIQN